VEYTIIKINDRAIENINKTKALLKDFNYIDDIPFFDSNKSNAWDAISAMGIRNDVWSPYDGRTFPALPGELGIWLSNINIFNYMISNNLPELLVLEDDAILYENFVENFNIVKKELPDNFDVFALGYPKEHNALDERTELGLNYIHSAINQYSNATGMLYSLKGAKKILKCLKRRGIEYTCDCFIFKLIQENNINGYSVIPEKINLIKHDVMQIPSLIDPDNLRNTDNT